MLVASVVWGFNSSSRNQNLYLTQSRDVELNPGPVTVHRDARVSDVSV